MIKIDYEKSIVIDSRNGEPISYPFGTPEAFNLLSQAWIRCGWDNKYVYSFTWLGRPIIQLPEDMIRIQEVIYQIKPDTIIETGIAHGGSLVFYASLCKCMGKGKVIGIDIEIRPHNRNAIEAHELFEFITLIEGSSTDKRVVDSVKKMISAEEKTLIVLDANHTKQHVLNELHMYSKFVSKGSYIVVCDGIMGDLVGAPRSNGEWAWNNPKAAIDEFIDSNKNFIIDEPEFPFNEGTIKERVTYWPSAFLKRIDS